MIQEFKWVPSDFLWRMLSNKELGQVKTSNLNPIQTLKYSKDYNGKVSGAF